CSCFKDTPQELRRGETAVWCFAAQRDARGLSDSAEVMRGCCVANAVYARMGRSADLKGSSCLLRDCEVLADLARRTCASAPGHRVDASAGQHGRSVAYRWIDELFIDPFFALFRLGPVVLEPTTPALGEHGTKRSQIQCVGVVRLPVATQLQTEQVVRSVVAGVFAHRQAVLTRHQRVVPIVSQCAGNITGRIEIGYAHDAQLVIYMEASQLVSSTGN